MLALSSCPRIQHCSLLHARSPHVLPSSKPALMRAAIVALAQLHTSNAAIPEQDQTERLVR